MRSGLSAFVRERFPIWVAVPLSLVLFGAPAVLVRLDVSDWLRGLATTFMALLVLRMVDDLSDIEVDAVTSPERGLVSGRIEPGHLKAWSAFFFLVMLVFNPSPVVFMFLLLGALFYFVYYRVRRGIVAWQPLLVNMVFPLVPVYACLLGGKRPSISVILLSIFIWSAVVGHDYGHSVSESRTTGQASAITFYSRLGPRPCAVLGALFYLCSLVTGYLAWLEGGLGILFLIALAIMSLVIARIFLALLKNPARSVARRLYVPGFLFFMVPMATIIVQGVASAITGR